MCSRFPPSRCPTRTISPTSRVAQGRLLPTPPMGRARPPHRCHSSLKMSSLAVTFLTAHSPIGPISHSQGQQSPFQEHPHHPHPDAISQHPHHTHSHSHSKESALSVSPMTPVSPQNFSPVHLSTQPTFTFDFDDPPGAGLSPDPDPVLQRRPSTVSHSTSLAELAVEKSVPQKRNLAGALPTSHTLLAARWSPNAFTLSILFKYHFWWPRLHSCTCTHSPPPNNDYHSLIPTASSISDIPFIIARFPFIYSLIHTRGANFRR